MSEIRAMRYIGGRIAARSAVAFMLTIALTGCGGELGAQVAGDGIGSSRAEPAGVRTPTLVDASPLSTLQSSHLRQRVLVSTRPPEILATSLGDIPDALTFAERATSDRSATRNSVRWSEAAQIGLLFGSPEGKAFLAATEGRALVRGEPAESCPSLNVATARTDGEATDGALRACLSALAADHNCKCRVLARGDHLLAPRDDFAYAIGVGTTILTPDGAAPLYLTSEERLVDGRPGARHVWIIGVDAQPYALLQVEADGRAALINSRTGEQLNGTHQVDGFRRGRIARRAYLTGENGKRAIVLVGYEDAEILDNENALTAWNPYGALELKKAEAE